MVPCEAPYWAPCKCGLPIEPPQALSPPITALPPATAPPMWKGSKRMCWYCICGDMNAMLGINGAVLGTGGAEGEVGDGTIPIQL